MTVVDGSWIVHHDDPRRVVVRADRRAALDPVDHQTLPASLRLWFPWRLTRVRCPVGYGDGEQAAATVEVIAQTAIPADVGTQLARGGARKVWKWFEELWGADSAARF